MEALAQAAPENRYCPSCGMRYRTRDGVLYPQGINPNDECDACHLEAVMNSIDAGKRNAVHSENRNCKAAYTGGSAMIPERKQRLIASVSETIGGFSISRQEIGTVMDLYSDVEIYGETLNDFQTGIRINRESRFWDNEAANSDGCGQKSLRDARQRLAEYLSNLGHEKRHDLMSMMYLGRNLDYYGLCQEAVVEFKLRAQDSAGRCNTEELLKHSQLKEWLRLVLELVET